MRHDERVRSYLRLTLADGVGAVLFARLVQAFGEPAAVPVKSPSLLQKVDGIGEKTARAIADLGESLIDEELAETDRCGATILTDQDDDYPAALKTVFDRPPLLYIRGRLEPADAVAFGVVGSRRCTHYGMEQAERFGQLLGRAGFTVVSGGARGIDTAAHRGSLAAGGRTIAVMGCGLGQTYPPENRAFFEQILHEGKGALLSELPMRTAVLGGNFPMRNRIISGLSLGVLVVEAARRSGSLITAKEAAEQGRVVFAVPGRVDSPLSQGSNQLIRDGAILVQNLDDILEHLEHVGAKMTPAPEEIAPQPLLPLALDGEEATLANALSAGPLSLDELVNKTRLPTAKVAAAMTMLVLKGVAKQKPGSVFVRAR